MPAHQLDRDSPMPLWAQLEADLRRRLDGGEFAERFATDAELVDSYGVSRHTVREAIRHLNRTGVLRRERGRGTVVNRAEFEQPLGQLYSLFRSIEDSGANQTSEVIDRTVTTNSVAAAALSLDEDAELVHLERLRLADGQPLAVDRAWMPLEIARPLLDVDFSHTALYDELERSVGLRPHHGWERVSPIIPSAADRDRLGLRRTDAAFHLERLGMVDGRPIEWRVTIIRGDRYRFVADWSSESQPRLTLSATD